MARKKRKYRNEIMGVAMPMVTAGVGMGYGISAIPTDLSGAAGVAAGKAASGVGKIAGKMPIVGTVRAAGLVMGGVRGMQEAASPMHYNNKKKKRGGGY